ncbi:hypothetical protein AMS68_000362 [Peltaster fructicola]|uniref:C2H2-type domain-containing protein n=1 Tax=Peltaster fructicola TaxID=286661 RepID=A0A6H0XJP9_9PEZI|nr:hypothetical protein AMS68_000362 [Peltaster fructicola]
MNDTELSALHKVTSNTSTISAGKPGVAVNGPVNGNFPPPKTDKPRPHVCGTCGRSFARLEHLKRHERSHTKEKPFECPECTRCFARRDLLLRHQQKLHMTNTASSRPRNARRESVAGTSVANNKVRKNSMATPNPNAANGVRPRANTIGHVDLQSLGLGNSVNGGMNKMNPLGLGIGMQNGFADGMGGMPNHMQNFGMSAAPHHNPVMAGLPKLNTESLKNMTMTETLHTAPPMAGFGGFDLDSLFSPGTTINPSQLHVGANTPGAFMPRLSPFNSAPQILDEDVDLSWMRNWSAQAGLSIFDDNENAIDESSPSRISSGDSPNEHNDSLANSTAAIHVPNSMAWSHNDIHNVPTTPFIDSFANLNAFGNFSPDMLQDPTPTSDNYFHNAMAQQHSMQQQQIQQQQAHLQQRQLEMQQQTLQGVQTTLFQPGVSTMSNFSSGSPSMSSSMGGSARQSSVTSASTDSITDTTRQALLASLAQPSVFGRTQRKYSQPSVSSPLSPGGARVAGPNLPSTADLRRYVDAFIQYALPHLPCIHVPTLTFDSLEFCSSIRTSNNPQSNMGNNITIMGGAGCLILAMAAMGALYEYDHPASKELFEAAKKMIGLYLEERRKADMSSSGGPGAPPLHTPLWLVQAMLLNIIYGHQCGDKTAADIASGHCAALVSLARAADLAEAVELGRVDETNGHSIYDMDLQTQWLAWKSNEERKRTFFAIFILSSLLTSGYNQTPTIMNSEIMLDLPCEEELWTAESAQEWQNRGGLLAAEQGAISFAHALSTLLTANQRQSMYMANKSNNPLNALRNGHNFAETEIRFSTFGCLVLINALHNYIWETRSRHNGRQWTAQETESMFSHIEPALNAWQAAWKANGNHKLERPHPFGLGPLSADSIPLLDLAFVHLFVNLGRAKEAFWRRDFDAMAEEIARGSELVQHAEGLLEEHGMDGITAAERASSRRERHLRKAAFYAADSLAISCNFNLTYADGTAHELPVQAAICFFDCGQVLGEWAATVQDRVGRYLGVLGRDPIDFSQGQVRLFLEEEDIELLQKIGNICDMLEGKRMQQENILAMDLQQLNPSAPVNSAQMNGNLEMCGYGSKLLKVLSMMLEKAAVWPLTHVMAMANNVLAAHMDRRANASIMAQ